MARGRMISTSLSTSKKFASLQRTAGDLCEFAQSLYPLIVVHTDDFGRMAGDAWSVKFQTHPTSTRTEADFEVALVAMIKSGLIVRYDDGNGGMCLAINDFDGHQTGLRHKTPSKYAPPGGPLSASERDIEAHVADALMTGALKIDDHFVTSVRRQVRVANSYIDIVAETGAGKTLVVEVKRQRLSNAAIEQVLTYRSMLAIDGAVPIVVGHGVAVGFKAGIDVVVIVYDDSMSFSSLSSHRVTSRQITSTNVPAEEKGREGKGTEGKGTEVPPNPHGGLSRMEPAPKPERLTVEAVFGSDPEPDPEADRIQAVMALWTKAWSDIRHGATYRPNPHREYAAFQELATTYGDNLPHLEQMFRAFFAADSVPDWAVTRSPKCFLRLAPETDAQLRRAS